METYVIFAVLVGCFTVCAGAISQARNQLKAFEAYVKKRYGEDLDMDAVEAASPLPAWMEAIDGWYYPSRLGKKLLRAGRAIGVLAAVPAEMDELQSVAPVVPLAGHNLSAMRALAAADTPSSAGAESSRGEIPRVA